MRPQGIYRRPSWTPWLHRVARQPPRSPAHTAPFVRGAVSDTTSVNSSTTLTAYPARPHQVQNGDVVLIFATAYGALGTPGFTNPSGFGAPVLTVSERLGLNTAMWAKKVTDASAEPDWYSILATNALPGIMLIDSTVAVIARADFATLTAAQVNTAGASGTSFSTASVTAPSANSLYVGWISATTQTAPTYSAYTNGATEVLDTLGMSLIQKQVGAGATGTMGATVSASSGGVGIGVAFGPGLVSADPDTAIVVVDGQSLFILPEAPNTVQYQTMDTRMGLATFATVQPRQLLPRSSPRLLLVRRPCPAGLWRLPPWSSPPPQSERRLSRRGLLPARQRWRPYRQLEPLRSLPPQTPPRPQRRWPLRPLWEGSSEAARLQPQAG